MKTALMFIPVAVYVIVMLLRLLLPNAPKVLWPALAPVLGIGVDLLFQVLGIVAQSDPALSAFLGSSGVGLRELIVKVIAQCTAPDVAGPPAPPK